MVSPLGPPFRYSAQLHNVLPRPALSVEMLKIPGQLKIPSMITVYPGYGHHANSNRNSDWKIRLSGVVYQIPDELSVRKRMLIRVLRNVMQVPADALECDLFRDRIAPFLADAQHRRQILVQIGDREFRLDKKTRRNGHFESWLRVPAELVETVKETQRGITKLRYRVGTELGDFAPVEAEAYLHQRDGICVISDIDDTIKDTGVTDRKELLANTFLREFRNIPGMKDIYFDWAQAGADFHYVSSSPWQLFHSLRQMQGQQGFPFGALHLRNFRLRDQLLKRVMIVRRPGKATAIRALLKNLPDRRFILVGDSGEKDPEIYAKICRQFPNQVLALFIRELPERPMSEDRRGKFKSIPHTQVEVFRETNQLADLAQPLFDRNVDNR